MLPKENRASRRELARAKSSNNLVRGRLFSVLVAEGDTDTAVFGMVVSTKVSRSAVTRNAIKRKIRSAILKKIKDFPRGQIYFFLTTKKMIDAPADLVSNEMDSLVKKLKKTR